jgi:nucleoside-diphosphate-sugar epimerase
MYELSHEDKLVKRVIITGATGFIGGTLAERLLKEGVSVYGVGRDKKKLDALCRFGDFHPVSADFGDYEKLDTLIAARGFDYFYHFAWNGTNSKVCSDYTVQSINIKVSGDALTAASRLECRHISFASSYQQADTVIGETIGFNPIYYGVVKRYVSDIFKAFAYQHGISCVNLIFPNVYGVNDKPNTAITFFIKSLLQNKPLNLISGEYQDDWMPVSDLVDGILAASRSPLRYGDFYVGHQNITTFKEKLTVMKRILTSSSDLKWGTYPENYYVDYSRFDLDALHLDTGWEAKTSFEESILETADWIKKSM